MMTRPLMIDDGPMGFQTLNPVWDARFCFRVSVVNIPPDSILSCTILQLPVLTGNTTIYHR